MLVQRIGSMTAEDFLQNFGGDIVIDDPIIAQAVTARRQKIKLEEEKCKLEEELEKQRQQNADNEEAIKKAQKEKEALERQQAIADAEAKQKLEKIEKKDAKADASTLAKNIRTVTSFVVTDASLVPRAYLIPDEKAIKSAIASGITDIPGVTITTEQVVR
jgi:type IV secretory pathway VirB10-like protein